MVRVGFSESIISPPNPSDHYLAGYIERKNKAKGINDDIYARIAYIEAHEGNPAIVINLDLLAVDEQMYRDIKDLVERKLGKDTYLLVSATHTHSAPLSLFRDILPGLGTVDFDKEYYELFLGKVEESLIEAVNNTHRTEVEVWIKQVIGVATDRNDPSREIDNQAISLVFKGGRGIDGIIVNYAIHPTVLGPDNLYISGDVIGYFIRHIKKILGTEHVLFINGAAANISTRFTRLGRSFNEAMRLGGKLAQQIASPDAKASAEINSIEGAEKTLELRARRLQRELSRYRLSEHVLKTMLLFSRGTKRRIVESRLEAIKAIAKIASRMNIDVIETRVSILRLGDEISIIACPLELDSSISLELKKISPYRYNIVSCYTNGYRGYLMSVAGNSYENIVQVIHPDEVPKVMTAIRQLYKEISL